MISRLIDQHTWDLAQARFKENARYRLYGSDKEHLLHQLREALVRDPALTGAKFRSQGIPQAPTYAKHFGSVTAAYHAVGRMTPTALGKLEAPCAASMRAGLLFLDDVSALIRDSGVQDLRVHRRRHLISIGGASIVVRVARRVVTRRGYVQSYAGGFTRAAAGERSQRWVLVLCLNADGCTAQDFYLLPPAAHQGFAGLFNRERLAEFAPFRIDTAALLLERILGLAIWPNAPLAAPEGSTK